MLKDCFSGNCIFFQNLWYCHTERAWRCQCWCPVMSQAFLHVKSLLRFENAEVNNASLSQLWSAFSSTFQKFVFLHFICFLITYSLLSLVLRVRIVAYPDIHVSFFPMHIWYLIALLGKFQITSWISSWGTITHEPLCQKQFRHLCIILVWKLMHCTYFLSCFPSHWVWSFSLTYLL